ncbi:MAG: dUTP diphosphatase [Veillonellales bacterium]
MQQRGFEIITAYLDADISLPTRQTAHSAGYDMEAAAAVVLQPKSVTMIPTGLKAYMREDEYLGVHIRSGFSFKNQVSLINSQGIIDADYYNNPDNEGHILIGVFNYGTKAISVKKGDRIAQGIFSKYLRVDADIADNTRTGGLGSTGK